MYLIQLEGISVGHAGRVLFRDLDFSIDPQDRVGLVGPNGIGKSSLLDAIAGKIPLDRGSITQQRGVRVGYLPQEVELPPGTTLLEAASVLPPRLAEVEKELARIEARLADPAVCNDPGRLERALDQQEKVVARYEELGGPSHRGRVRELLSHFGFEEADDDLPTETLSGGQKKLVALIGLVLESPEVLLLDEADNHLDLEAKQRLERFIREYPGAVVEVSHDRYLLDETATRIAELDEGRLTIYPGNYTAYSTERERRRLQQKRLHAVQQKEIARIEASIRRFEEWASRVVNERHAKQARSRRKHLERMEASGELVDDVHDRRPIDLRLEGWRGSQQALELTELRMGFDGRMLFEDLELLVRHGERVALIGPNGTGKSVLLRLVLGQIEPLGGRIKIGPSTRIGYYSQEHERLGPWLDRTPLELVRDTSPMTEERATGFLLKFRFAYEQVRQPIRTMSGGERSRLQLGCLMLEQPNLLILDEPTNNLDIPSAEVLERELDGFEGSILVISHDRYFLDRVADRVLELRDGALNGHLGGYTEYLERTGQLQVDAAARGG
ncbi:MAG: ABC-F family ATP-binding cassette domain-containing protein [Myxococcota bacterium]